MGEMKYYLTYPDRKALEDARDDLGNHGACGGTDHSKTDTVKKSEGNQQRQT